MNDDQMPGEHSPSQTSAPPVLAPGTSKADPAAQRPSAVGVILLTCAIAIVPSVILEWNREPARWLAARAANDASDHAFQKAEEQLDLAIERDPDNLRFYLQRASSALMWVNFARPWRRQEGELPPSEEKTQQLLEQASKDIARVLEVFPTQRVRTLCSEINLRLGNGEAAVQQWAEAAKSPPEIRPEMLLNQYAYMRACANLELEQGLEQANSALDFLPDASETRTAVIDTRGYLYYRLERYEDALKDINEAVEGYRKQTFDPWNEKRRGMAAAQLNDRDLMDRDIAMNEAYGTLIYHRMLVHEAMGAAEAAEADLDKLKELLPGYDGHELW